MDASEASSDVLADLAARLRAEEDIVFAVAFGSRISGSPTVESDLDVAVKFTDQLDDGDRFRTRCHLSGHLQVSGAATIDLSDIDELPLEVAHAAVNGEFLCGNEHAFESFKSGIESEFAERRDEIDARHRDVIHRIATEGLHG